MALKVGHIPHCCTCHSNNTYAHLTFSLQQIRLEISDVNAFPQIIMELDVLHKSQSPYIVEFYGAFFIESTVYLCMEVELAR